MTGATREAGLSAAILATARSRRGRVAAIVTLAVSVALAVFAASPLVGVAAFVNGAVLLASTGTARPWWAAPALIVSWTTTVIGIGGLLVGNSLGAVGTGAVDQVLDQQQLVMTFVLFMTGSALVVLPTLLASRLMRSSTRTPPVTALPTILDPWIVVAGAVVAVGAIAILGPAWLLSRPERFGETSPVTNAISALALGMSVLLGPPVVRARASLRAVAIGALVVFAFVFFSSASRYLCLQPIAIAAGVLLLGGLRRHRLLLVGASLVLAIVLLPIPLFLRGSEIGHGFLPYVAWMSHFHVSGESVAGYVNNILVSFRITGVTAFQEPAIPLRVLGISLAPGAGASVGWYDVAPSLRLNEFSPYSGLGELGNYGPLPCVLTLLGIGIAMAALAVIGARLDRAIAGRIIVAAVLAVQLLFAVQFTQYNLRNDVRLLYYCLALEIAAAAIGWLVIAVRRSRSGPGGRRALRPERD